MASAPDDFLNAAIAALGENLLSCCLYGSAVRGNRVAETSDWNYLLILERSDAAAHEAIGRVLAGHPRVDPFVLGRSGFARSARMFAAKFSSIKRNYRLLWGQDFLADLTFEPELEKFLCEQALRNFRLRMAFSYLTRTRSPGSYGRFLRKGVTPLFLRLSEIIRLQGGDLPVNFPDRIPILAREFGLEEMILSDWLSLKKTGLVAAGRDETTWHARAFPVPDRALSWIEAHWPREEGKGVLGGSGE